MLLFRFGRKTRHMRHAGAHQAAQSQGSVAFSAAP
jgi:hypothetical protein